jgi:hypothetical protein
MRALVFAVAMMASGAAWAVPGRCLLVVDGKTYLNGPCKVETRSGGNFQVLSSGRLTYFANVSLTGDNEANGFWNEEMGANHAHTPLGSLRRNDACWANDKAIVCAWR